MNAVALSADLAALVRCIGAGLGLAAAWPGRCAWLFAVGLGLKNGKAVQAQCITRNDPAPLVGKQSERAVRGAVQPTLLTPVFPSYGRAVDRACSV
jgi:hypothetical protein